MKIPDEIAERCETKIVDTHLIITEITPIEPCEDCGADLDAVRIKTMSKIEYPYRHWRNTCKTCKRVQNPITGAYDCDTATANALARQKWAEMNRKR